MRESKSTFRPGRRFRALLGVLSLLSGVLTYTAVAVSPASAAGGSYALNFAAADPSIYLPPIPYPTDLTAPTGSGDGSVLIPLADFDDGTGAVFVESLAPQDMALGQIVPFFVEIDVTGSVAPENGEISFLVGWNTLTTNSGDFGYDARVDDIGYEVIGAFVDTSDGAHLDGGTAATVSSFSSSVVNDEIVGAFTVTGLDDGDTVVVEMWVVLDDTIPAGIGGNVQSRLIDAATGSDASYSVANSGAITLDNGDSISTGAETVPLLKPSDFFTADVDVSVTKTDNPDPVELDGTLTYTITVANAGPSVANSVVVYDELDPNTTFVSASDGGIVNTDPGDTIPDGAVQWDVGSLAPGDSAQYTVTVTVNNNAPTDSPTGEDLLNTVTVTTISDDTNTTNNVDTEPTDVNAQQVVAPDITLVKTANPTSVDEPGGNVTFTVEITNDGDAGTIDSLGDDIHGDLAANCLDGAAVPLVGQTIDAGQTLTCTFTAAVNGMGGDSETDTVTTVVSNDGGSDTASDTATVTINDVPAAILVTKTASPDNVPETGGAVTYIFSVENTSATDSVTIDSLVDSIYGDLNGQGDCATGAVLAPGDTYICSITENVSGQAGQIINNVLTVAGTDDDNQPVGGTDDADVTVTDVPAAIEIIKTADPTSVDEPGGSVTFSFTINNLSTADSVTIDSLTDTVYGDLNGQGDCSTPQTIAAGGSYNCSFTTTVTGNAGTVETNVVTASGLDDDGNPVFDDDDATVTVNDVPASIEVTKVANPTSVSEPGDNVTFTFTVNNTSATDSVTINTLSDSVYGDLNGQGDCSTPQAIAAGGSYSCSITELVAGNAGDQITNVLTVAGVDDDGNPVGGTDDAMVDIDDVPSSILVTKTASPTSVPETGGDVTYTVVIENTSAVDTVTINTLTDDRVANAADGCVPALPTDIAPGETITCTYTAFVEGDTGGTHTNVATAMGEDDDGNPVMDDDDETITFDDVDASIEIIKTATPTSVDEPGGNVTFNFVINNTSPVDLVNITSLEDSIYGDLNGQGDCSVPQTLLVGGSYSCSITEFVAGNAGVVETNVVTATGIDDDGETVTDDDDATVTINDVPSSILVTKTANPTSVPESGGDVTFTVTVENTSAVDDVTISSVIDDQFGDVSASCAPALPATIAPGGTITCTFTEFISGNADETHVNVATASGTDDDGGPVEDDDQEEVPFDDVKPDITVVKTADPSSVPETGADVEFTFLVTNLATEDATLDSLVDSDFGDLNGQGTCVVPQPLSANGGTYECSIVVNISGDAGGPDHENTVTATASDDDGNSAEATDDETVILDDVLPDVTITKTANPTSVPETGGNVEFTIVVTNNSLEDATIDSLVDSDFDLAINCPDAVGTVLGSGDSYTCVFTETLAGDASGPAHENTATVVVSDGDGNTDTESDDEIVTFDDVLPTITVSKTADPTSVEETGGDVEFTIVVTNTGDEAVTIDSLVDSDFDLAANCADAAGTVLAPGGTYTCVFTETLTGDASGLAHENTATAQASDNEGNPAEASDDATVDFSDVLPDISVIKTADPTAVPETGGDVTYTVDVTNNSTEDATLDSLVDDKFGSLGGQGDCATGGTIPAGSTYSCSFTIVGLSGQPSSPHINTVTAIASDNDGNTAEASDDATVTFIDVLPDVAITKTADPTSVPETGADVDFTIVVTNNSLEDATIDLLIDTDFNVGVNCPDALGTVLASGESYICVFTEFIVGDASGPDHENTATVTVSDGDGNFDTESDDETVVFEDVLPDISVTKTPSVDSVPETGGLVDFEIVVTNNSTEDATLISLVDTVYGDLDGIDDCSTTPAPVLSANGGTYTCTVRVFLTGDASGDPHNNVVTATAADDDGNTDSASDDALVAFDDVLPTITVSKTADPTSVPETGGDVEFTIVVRNTSEESVTIDSLVDSDFDLVANCADAVGTVLAPGGTYTCVFTETLTGDASGPAHENTATAVASDNEGNAANASDDAIVTYDDVLPDISVTKTADPMAVPETGADVTFSFVVTNNAAEDATLDSLVDSDFGDLNGQGTCAVPQPLPANGGDYTCQVTVFISGDFGGPSHENTVTAIASDNEANTAEDSDDATVDFTDVLPDVSITKTANPTSVDEPGGEVEFTIVVTNNSLEDATIDSLVDSDFDLAANCADAVGTTLASGDSYTCVFTEFVAGNTADGNHVNTATVVASDDDGNTDTESDDETVVINDVAPVIDVTKTPSQDEVFAPGEDVTFTIRVENNSVSSDPVTITSIVDDVFGDVSGECVLPQTIGTGGAFECDITRLITADHANTATVTANDDEGNEVMDSDDASVEVSNPSIDVEKTTNGFDADTAPGPEILVGAEVLWQYTVTNDGDVTVDVTDVVDDQGLVLDCPPSSILNPGDAITCAAFGTSVAGQYGNVGSATATYTDADGTVATRSDTDPSNYFGAAPSVDITKTFADDSVIAGGAGSSFALVVENDGNVDLDAVSITDAVDPRLEVSSVTSAEADCSASAGQNVDCVVDLAVGETATVTVNFSVDSATPEALGVENTASADDTYTDDSGNTLDHGDTDSDTIDILTDIELSLDKTFDPSEVPQGTIQSFTIKVSNAGPSDAVGVTVDDLVDDSIAVSAVTLASGSGDCSASSGQTVDCTVDIPAGGFVTITVDYVAAPFLDGSSGNLGGDDFRFVFVNGSVLEGSTATGDVFLDGVDVSGNVTIISSLTRNDVIFDPPGPDPAFELHLSCSDPFTGGWGQSGGPVQGVDTNWQIAYFSIARFNNNGFIKNCGNVTNAFDVPNTATATGEDSFGEETVSDSATLTIGPGITLDRLQTNGKRLTVRLTNFTGDDKIIDGISAVWPNSNGNLTKVRLDDPTVWQGNDDPPEALLDASDSAWIGGTLVTGEGILRFDFENKSARTGYTIRVTFTDGTFLDINQ